MASPGSKFTKGECFSVAQLWNLRTFFPLPESKGVLKDETVGVREQGEDVRILWSFMQYAGTNFLQHTFKHGWSGISSLICPLSKLPLSFFPSISCLEFASFWEQQLFSCPRSVLNISSSKLSRFKMRITTWTLGFPHFPLSKHGSLRIYGWNIATSTVATLQKCIFGRKWESAFP